MAYAQRFLPADQIDAIDVTTLPGYQALESGS
jgi:hypothetical protein